jgi:outer membrane protein OmpA-like peptidoglycan-associated protein
MADSDYSSSIKSESTAQSHRAAASAGSWKDPKPKSKAPLIFFLFVVLLVLSSSLVMLECSKRQKRITTQNSNAPAPLVVENKAEPKKDPMQEAEESLKTTGVSPVQPAQDDPLDLVTAIGNALANQDYATAEKLIGKQALTSEMLERLKKLSGQGQLKLRLPNPVREVGEIEVNKRARYSLELADREAGRDRIYFDLMKKNNLWSVEKLTLPPSEGEAIARALIVDSLGISDAFLLAALNQNFALAKEFVNPEKVSDATLAGLCILFEEGNYKLREEKPLRSVIQKETVASFLANVEASDGTQAAQFAITLKKSSEHPNWVIDELNLDQLLSDYANRVAGGDVYYTPLIKNPAGGDTLVLYFDFDAEEITPRTERQLAIVAMILKTDNKKKIHLSGHTDALGSADYNQSLSAKRAEAVKENLITAGVNPAQIVTAAKGLSEPRRPNVNAEGQDDPDGRRANRRTEIYLDF